MSNKTFTRFVAIMTVSIMIVFFGLVKVAQGNETMPQPKPKSFAENKIESVKLWAVAFGAEADENWKETVEAFKTDWSWSEGGRFTYRVKNEWEDIKHYQRMQWHEGTQQLKSNLGTIKGFFGKLGIF